MRYILTATAAVVFSLGVVQAASAADMPAKMPVKAAPIVAPYNWTGFYVGVNAGGAWGNTTAQDTLATNGAPWVTNGASWSSKPSGLTAAVEAGYNWQFNTFVLGIEGEVGYLGVRGSAAYPLLTSTFVDTQGGLFTTVRGRAGLAFDRWLVYGTGGYFGADLGSSVQTSAGAPVALLNIQKTGFQSGWTAGGGAEYGISRNWTVKGEWLYYALPNKQVGDNFAGGGATVQFFNLKNTGNILRLGVNYRF
jgi:outer membrane immunogenic protein